MIYLRDIVQFPAQFRHRFKKLYEVGFTSIQTDQKENSIQFIGTTAKSGHTTQIEMALKNGRIDMQSPIQMRCSCESFQYEFMFPAHKQKGLLGELPQLPPGKSVRPKVKNPYSVVGGCKHIIKLAKYIQTQRSKIY